MRNSKLLFVLKNLDKYEHNRLRKLLTSPYFNRSEAIVRLYDYLVKHLSKGKGDEIDKEACWKIVQPDAAFNDMRLRKFGSDLLKLIEEFFIQEELKLNEGLRQSYLLASTGKRKIPILLNSTKAKIKTIKEGDEENQQLFFNNYLTEKTQYDIWKIIDKKTGETNLKDVIANLDKFYLVEKLKYYCHTLSRRAEIEYTYDDRLIPEILDFLSKDDTYLEVPIIKAYYLISIAFQNFNQTDQYYFELKEHLKQKGSLIDLSDGLDAYSFAINYCIRKANSGQSAFLKEYFDLNKSLVEDGFLTVIEPGLFKNLVTAGLRLGEIEWIEFFINNYQHLIPAEQRENAVTFNLSTLYFYKKDYNKVIELLREVEYQDFLYNLNSKTTLLMTYYEEDEIEPLYHLMESFRVFVNRRKEITTQKKKDYINLIKFVKKLTKVIPGDKKAIEKIKRELAQTKRIASLNWLKAKIAEME